MKSNLSSLTRSLFIGLLFLIALSATTFGQTVSGTLRGTITDPNGAVIPTATVQATSTETGLERTVTTGDDGVYNFAFLPIGTYRLVVTRNDFNRVTQDAVGVTLNQTTVINVQLAPTVSGEVTVTNEGAPINTSDAQIAQSLQTTQILERPIANQTNFLTLAETFTGYQENPTSGQNNPTSSSGSSINFNGTGTRGATFQINGVNNDDSSENQNRQGASLATIKEFQVISNNFTAEFGRGYGAVVLVQTLNGTNDFRGSAYWYHNDQALNAKSYFSHGKKAVFRRNQFGGVLGFPIFKNKLFGFASVDETRRTGNVDYTRDVLTAYERNPANWFLVTPANDTPANRAFIQSIVDRFDGLIPNDPANRSPRTYVGTTGQDFPANDYSFRLDWNATSKDTLFARWQYTRQIFDTNDVVLGEQAFQNNKQQNYGLTWTHIFSNNIVGEFRYGLGLRNTLVNIAAGNDTPIARFNNNPNTAVSGSIIGNAGAFPIQRYQTDNQFVYNLSSIFGNHYVKSGADLRFQILDDLADSFSRGFWSMNALCNGTTYRDPVNNAPSSYIAFINGCVSSHTKGYGAFFLENRIGESNFYIEDNWKIFPSLTLNLGARYEYVNAPRELQGRIEYGFSDDKNNIEPRVGFAYSPEFEGGFLKSLFGEAGDSSIRGGYGIYHGRLFQSVFAQGGAGIRFNPPNALQRVVSNSTNISDPTNGFVFAPGIQSARFSPTTPEPNLEMPYTQQWSMTFERKLPWSSSFRATYTGNRGIGLLKFFQGNAPRHTGEPLFVQDHPNNSPTALGYGALPANDPRRVDVRGQLLRPAADILCAGTGLTGIATTAQCPNAVAILPNEYSFRVLRINERREDGRWTSNLLISNNAWSYYHGMQLEWIKRLSANLSFSAAYTWSKAIDTTSEATALNAGDSNQNGNDAKVSRGLSRFHTPHRFTFFGSYTTPFFDKDRGILGHLLGGWQVSGVFKWAHGTPFTVISTGVDLNLDNFSEARPILLDPSVLGRSIDDPATARDMLPASAFRLATLADFGAFGTSVLGRNTFYVDGVKNVDLSLTKRFLMPWERHSLMVRADLFNAFNHVQWGFPQLNLSTANFGALTGTATQYAPRNIQVSLKYSF
ncbi:MAG: carboxypeptidase regulatory-like domain-containing protein [Pyrinomonadaceae bacterium]